MLCCTRAREYTELYMKSMTLSAWMMVVGAAVLGCTPKPKMARYTVEQYLADRELMNKKVEECANNPGDLNDDPDCNNALAAAERASYRSMRELDRERRNAAPANAAESSSTR